MAREAWWERGECRTADPRIFDGKASPWSDAKRLCRRCPVQAECLEYVLSLPLDSHVQGTERSYAAGFTPKELDMIRRKRGLR